MAGCWPVTRRGSNDGALMPPALGAGVAAATGAGVGAATAAGGATGVGAATGAGAAAVTAGCCPVMRFGMTAAAAAAGVAADATGAGADSGSAAAAMAAPPAARSRLAFRPPTPIGRCSTLSCSWPLEAVRQITLRPDDCARNQSMCPYNESASMISASAALLSAIHSQFAPASPRSELIIDLICSSSAAATLIAAIRIVLAIIHPEVCARKRPQGRRFWHSFGQSVPAPVACASACIRHNSA